MIKKSLRFIIAAITIFALWSSATTWEVGVFKFFSMFTYDSNLIVALVLILVSVNKLNSKYMLYATIYITITMIIYHLLLGDGLASEAWTSIVLHYLIPLYMIFDLLVLTGIEKVKYTEAFKVIVFPLIYFAYAMIFGALTSNYPYFFLDINEVGILGLFKWIVILLIVFGIFSSIYIKIVNFKNRNI